MKNKHISVSLVVRITDNTNAVIRSRAQAKLFHVREVTETDAYN
jgi:hypothetical protein